MHGARSIFICTLLWLFAHTDGVKAAPGHQLYDRAAHAGVELLVDGHLDGSGAIVSSQGLVLTAAHLLRPGTTPHIEVRSRSIGRLVATVVALDRGHDLALLQLPRRKGGYPALALARALPPPGREVYLFGSPLYRHAVLLRGALARPLPTYEYHADGGHYLRVIHLSAASPVGTSGGPWLDEKGRLIGIQAGLVHNGVASVGIAYMAPLDAVRRLVRRQKAVSLATVRAGFEELWEQGAALRALFPPSQQGVLPVRIVPGGPADLAGLRPTDLITALDGHPIALRDQLLDQIRARPPYKPFTLRIFRPHVGPMDLPIAPHELGRSPSSPPEVLALRAGKTPL